MLLTRRYKQFAGLLFPPDPIGPAVDPSQYERLAIPFTFKPRMSLFEATLSVMAALARIILGSLLFAVCGTLIWMTAAAISNPFLRALAVAPMVLIFLVLMALLMIGIGLLLRRLLSLRQMS